MQLVLKGTNVASLVVCQMFYKGSRSTDVRDNDAFPQH